METPKAPIPVDRPQVINTLSKEIATNEESNENSAFTRIPSTVDQLVLLLLRVLEVVYILGIASERPSFHKSGQVVELE